MKITEVDIESLTAQFRELLIRPDVSIIEFDKENDSFTATENIWIEENVLKKIKRTLTINNGTQEEEESKND